VLELRRSVFGTGRESKIQSWQSGATILALIIRLNDAPDGYHL
jgi:hypothetical protein